MDNPIFGIIAQQQAAVCPKLVFPPLTGYVPGNMGVRSMNSTQVTCNFYFQRDRNLEQLASAQQAQNAVPQSATVLQLVPRDDNNALN
jgi:hypothetical protein